MEVTVPRGRPRSVPVSDSDVPPITLAEAARRGYWAVHKVRDGVYVCAAAGKPLPGQFVCWTSGEKAAYNACEQRARDDVHGAAHRGGKSRRAR